MKLFLFLTLLAAGWMRFGGCGKASASGPAPASAALPSAPAPAAPAASAPTLSPDLSEDLRMQYYARACLPGLWQQLCSLRAEADVSDREATRLAKALTANGLRPAEDARYLKLLRHLRTVRIRLQDCEAEIRRARLNAVSDEALPSETKGNTP